MRRFYPKEKLAKTSEEDSRFALGDHQERMSEAGAALPIGANGSFMPVRVRLIRGKAELLPSMNIVKKLGAQVCFGSDRCNVAQGEWGE